MRGIIPGIGILVFVCSHSVKVDWITFPTACAMSGTRDTGRGWKVPRHGIDEGRRHVYKCNDDELLTQKYEQKGDCYCTVVERKEK